MRTALCGLMATIVTMGPVSAQTAAPAAASADTKIELNLFSKEEVDRSKGCSVVLWQSNRDPEKDRYAHIFQEKLGADHARQPARIKIGEKIVSLRRVATGGKTTGYKLFESQLYKMEGEDGFAVLDLKLAPEEGEAIEISDGTMVITQPGKISRTISVKGSAGCFTPAAAASTVSTRPNSPPVAPSAPANAARGRPVAAKTMPAAMLRDLKSKAGCNSPVMTSGVVAHDLTEEASLWEIPCELFAYQATSAFAIVHNGFESQYTLMTFKAPPGVKRDGAYGLMGANWSARTKTLVGVWRGRADGDCGTYEVHRLEDTSFSLREYRDKPNCDGKGNDPSKFPLVFKAK